MTHMKRMTRHLTATNKPRESPASIASDQPNPGNQSRGAVSYSAFEALSTNWQEDNNMKQYFPHGAARLTLAAAFAFGLASAASAQTQASTAPPPVDPSFSAYWLSQLCQQPSSDNVSRGQCVSAIRGIIHGYQYGVLFLGQRGTLPTGETQRVSLCLRNTPVPAIVDEFVADTRQVDADALKRTPAEVAVLGSVHMHHACE